MLFPVKLVAKSVVQLINLVDKIPGVDIPTNVKDAVGEFSKFNTEKFFEQGGFSGGESVYDRTQSVQNNSTMTNAPTTIEVTNNTTLTGTNVSEEDVQRAQETNVNQLVASRGR